MLKSLQPKVCGLFMAKNSVTKKVQTCDNILIRNSQGLRRSGLYRQENKLKEQNKGEDFCLFAITWKWYKGKRGKCTNLKRIWKAFRNAFSVM